MFLASTSKFLYYSSDAFSHTGRRSFSRFVWTNVKFWKVRNDFESLYKRYDAFKAINSTKMLKSWSQQFESVIVDRIRKSLQLLQLQRKWWGDFMTKFMLQRLAIELAKKKNLRFTFCLAPLFSWDNSRISESEIEKLRKDIDNCKTYFRDSKNDDTPGDNKTDNLCSCDRCKHMTFEGWSLFVIKKDFQIWRKEHTNYPNAGLYVYKVFGNFPDITANDFFRVQLDVDYRKQWDSNSVALNIIESDPNSNSDILYWEFQFPRMFYNRDYVCNRRYNIDDEKNLLTIISESVEHPNCPQKPPIHRVKEYWSCIVIKPTGNSFDEPGVEFSITYFDNPELIIPAYISVWYSATGMPDYIDELREAALKLAQIRKANEYENRTSAMNKENSSDKVINEKRFMLL